jgi:Spy/CpxP family protein refolding chaperone
MRCSMAIRSALSVRRASLREDGKVGGYRNLWTKSASVPVAGQMCRSRRRKRPLQMIPAPSAPQIAAQLRTQMRNPMNSQWKRMMVRSAAVLLCSTGLVVATAMAQDTSAPPPPPPGQQGPPPEGGYGGRGGMHPERRVEMMQKRLGLSDDQTAQVKGVFETERGKMEALRSNSSLSRPEMRSQMMALPRTRRRSTTRCRPDSGSICRNAAKVARVTALRHRLLRRHCNQ